MAKLIYINLCKIIELLIISIYNLIINMVAIIQNIINDKLIADILLVINNSVFVDNSTNLSTRYILPTNLPDYLYSNIINNILSSQPNISVRNIRCYKQTYGDIKEHFDVSYDGFCNHTLIIYLNDDYEGSILSIKDHNKTYTIKPTQGIGVLFNKKLLHSSNYIYGVKYSLVIDIFKD